MASTSTSNRGGFITSIATVALVAVGCGLLFSRKRRVEQETESNQKEISCRSLLPENKEARNDTSNEDEDSNLSKKRILPRGTITIAHGSVTGTCASLAQKLYDTLSSHPSIALGSTAIQMGRVEEWDWWDELLNNEDDTNTSSDKSSPPPIVVWILPTYTGGEWPPSALSLKNALHEMQHDWRVEKRPLKSTELRVVAFGMGSSAYGDDTMGKPARDVWVQARKLGAKTLGTIGVGDDSVGDHKATFDTWMTDVVKRIDGLVGATSVSCACSNGGVSDKNESNCCQIPSSSAESDIVDNGEFDSDEDSDVEEEREPVVMDLEDMGDSLKASTHQTKDATEMVTPTQAAALKKEGYKLIGTHSAVKLCRWTKHQLRGRGGCYKHTFYGITSYQCMEATPSLACANKCVFCWRHHKNPVGKEWRWKTDDPHYIVDEAVKTHVRMIKETKGIPGVRMDRWEEAHTVRHCALSLVGEPIMYPRIHELLGDLHNRKISTFLVTNGQHPQAISDLRPITQLYVSVDAPTPESLIAIDRPLFQDAWDRLKESLVSLKAKGQRTVARLTVVKGWNSDEVEGYAKLIALGQCSLVEVKGVTFCGKSDASNLNMSNTPWHHEVVSLTQALQKELCKLTVQAGDDAPPEYGLACEHKHSCSVLLARVDQFAENDPDTGERRWKTWIDYDKFHDLAQRNATDPSFTFSVQDYTAYTPSWALFGATEEGFDPTDVRHRKKKKHPKYARFDDRGVPTHDHNNEELSAEERQRLAYLMEEKMRELGSESTVTELKGGAKKIEDARLMFRGLVVVK